jgi:hypothetical protein
VTGADCTRPVTSTLFAIFTIVFCFYLFLYLFIPVGLLIVIKNMTVAASNNDSVLSEYSFAIILSQLL